VPPVRKVQRQKYIGTFPEIMYARIYVIKKLGGIIVYSMTTNILYRKFHKKRKTFTHIPTRTKKATACITHTKHIHM